VREGWGEVKNIRAYCYARVLPKFPLLVGRFAEVTVAGSQGYDLVAPTRSLSFAHSLQKRSGSSKLSWPFFEVIWLIRSGPEI
jgi:hypothetical protein